VGGDYGGDFLRRELNNTKGMVEEEEEKR